MINSSNDGYFTINARVSLPQEQQDYYYMSCPACFHNTTANPGIQFSPRNCNKQNLPKPSYRARCTITISDDQKQLTITAFNEVTAKLLNLSPTNLFNMATQDTTINIPTIKCGLEKETFKRKIRKKGLYLYPSSSILLQSY